MEREFYFIKEYLPSWKFYRTTIRSAMLYGTKCWVTKKQQVIKMSVAEMRMLRWMCGKTRNDRIRNVNIRDMVGVALIEDNIRERLRWFGHICRRPIDAVVRRSDTFIGNDSTKGMGRPNLTLDVVVKKDMSGLNLSQHLAIDRSQWRKRIYVADPN